MISLNLTQRIWLSFSLLILLVGSIIAVVYPLSIQGAIKEQSYQIIEFQQSQKLRNAPPDGNQYASPGSGADLIKKRDAARSVEHFLLARSRQNIDGHPVVKKMAHDAFAQKENTGRYSFTFQGITFFYVIRKVTVSQQKAYLVSYMLDTYQNELISTLWKRLLWILLFAGLLGLAIALWLARYLRKPLILLGNHFEEISKRNWDTPFEWHKDDEFGSLSDQFEQMRQNLVRYDRSQKTFIQHASHELKTPIMTIHSYAQSVKDGVMPKKDLPETMDVIIGESQRMDQRVKELIYYTKLDAMKDETPHRDQVKFGSVVQDIIDRLQVQREDVTFHVRGGEHIFYVDPEQWKILVENLIENALRYAQTDIRIGASDDVSYSVIEVYNDGASIPEADRIHLFDPFYKGAKGRFGLGLAIVHRIVELHQGYIEVQNKKNGISFIVKFPKQSNNNTSSYR